ncbi:MAG: ISKra4 family transposase [Ktedonobacteraceae bacterium]
MGRVFFPLDEELGLVPGSLAPRQHEHLVHLASWMPFGRTVEMLSRLLGVQVSEETVRRLTEQAGAQVEAAQTEQAQEPWHEEAKVGGNPERLVLSADGAMVPLRGGEWAEVRTVAIGEVHPVATTAELREVHVEALSYFSRLTDAESFATLVEVEMRRRRVVQATAVAAVTDGADWLQGLVDLHRPDAVRILDFPHAAEHGAAVLQTFAQAGQNVSADLLARCLHILKHRGPAPLLRLLSRLPPELAEREGVREHVGYLRKREALMQYPQFRRDGWPIGSGMVESANKLIVEARLKGAGMHWHRKNVNPLLALRNGVCNQRWQETWRTALAHQHCQRHIARTARAQSRIPALAVSEIPVLDGTPASAPLPPSPPLLPPEPAATLPGSSRPSPHHPWKKTPACAPKLFAKN